MSNRHIARSVVVQTLFEGDMHGWILSPSEHKEDFERSLERNTIEFALGTKLKDFSSDLLTLTLAKRGTLDEIITKAAPEWPLEKIANVDRNVLRLGLAELLYGDRTQVPPKVAIDEAIELAKNFGGDTSGKFVNGVLGAIYKEMGEPGKHEQRKDKEVIHKKEEDISLLPVERLGGAVVYAKNADGAIYFALVHDIFGKWTLSKGHLDNALDVVDATVTRVREELGLPIVIEEKIGENEYVAVNLEKKRVRKQVTYYIAQAPFQEIQFTSEGGLDDAKWFPVQEITELPLYSDLVPILSKAVQVILKK